MARADAGLTISEVAARAGVSRDTVSKLEKGQHSPQASTLNKIARALGKTPSELLAEEERLNPLAQAPSQPKPSFEEVAGRLDAAYQLAKLLQEARALRAEEHIETAAAALDRILSERVPTAEEGLITAEDGLAPTAEEGLFDLIEAVIEENEYLKTRISELEAA